MNPQQFGVRVAVVTCGTSSATVFDFARYTSAGPASSAVQQIPYGRSQFSAMKHAFEFTAANVLTVFSGMRGYVFNVARILVLVTSGDFSPRTQDPAAMAQQLRSKSVQVFAVGVKGYSMSTLKAAASSPSSTYVLTVPDFSNLATQAAPLAKTICVAGGFVSSNPVPVPPVLPTPINPTPPLPPSDPSVAQKCMRPVDLVILVDESGSITPARFNLVKAFVKQVAAAFSFSSDPLGARLSVVKVPTLPRVLTRSFSRS